MIWGWGAGRGAQADYCEQAGSLELTCKGNHEGWRAAGLFPSSVTGLSSGVSVDPLHVPQTSSTSSPPFSPTRAPPYPGGWCKVNLAGIF